MTTKCCGRVIEAQQNEENTPSKRCKRLMQLRVHLRGTLIFFFVLQMTQEHSILAMCLLQVASAQSECLTSQ